MTLIMAIGAPAVGSARAEQTRLEPCGERDPASRTRGQAAYAGLGLPVRKYGFAAVGSLIRAREAGRGGGGGGALGVERIGLSDMTLWLSAGDGCWGSPSPCE